MRGVEKTVVLRVYESEAVSIQNGTRFLNQENDGKRFTTADTLRKTILENKRLRIRNKYLESKL